jgi:hypothetical protein
MVATVLWRVSKCVEARLLTAGTAPPHPGRAACKVYEADVASYACAWNQQRVCIDATLQQREEKGWGQVGAVGLPVLVCQQHGT